MGRLTYLTTIPFFNYGETEAQKNQTPSPLSCKPASLPGPLSFNGRLKITHFTGDEAGIQSAASDLPRVSQAGDCGTLIMAVV